MDTTTRLADNTRYYRNRMGLTQRELAAKMDSSQPYLARIENGTANPTLSMIQRLSSALGVTVLDLLRQRKDVFA